MIFNSPSTTDNPQHDSRRLQRSFLVAAGFSAILWLIKIYESLSGISLSGYGIYPGSLAGLFAIPLAPLIHGSFGHLLANTAPLIILGTALLYGYPRAARLVIPLVYLGSGLCVWIFGRHAWHIGASGVVFGFLLFVFTIGAIRWDRKAIALSMLVFFLYGGMLVGVLPDHHSVSHESHACGAIIGLLLAVLFRDMDPPPQEKKYSWDDEEEEEDDTESENRGL